MNAPNAPFLTELDRRAEVKGSRDPLGIQSVWVRFGRHVVGNLTTVSNSLRDFTTLLLGYHLAETVATYNGPGTELEAFLRWEQICAYSRLQINGDGAFRGVERARKALSDGSRVTISSARQHQILSNQKTYGLWGLYSVPSASSGLIEQDPPRLTPIAREFVQQAYTPVLQRAGTTFSELAELVAQDRFRFNIGEDNRVVRAASALLKPRVLASEQDFYRGLLIEGGPSDSTGGRQAALAALFDDERFAQQPLSPALLRALVKQAASTNDAELATRLDRIRICESVVAPASMIFAHMLGLEGQAPDVLDKRLRNQLGLRVKTIVMDEVEGLREELGKDDKATGDRWVAIGKSLADGDYKRLIDLLIEQNKSVMTMRGGTSWIEVQKDRFSVRFKDVQGELPHKDGLPGLWRFPYFIDSLRQLNDQLRGG